MATRTPPRPTVASHFARRPPEVRAIYRAVLAAARKLGRVAERPNQGSIHLVRKTVFASVSPRGDALIVTLKSTEDYGSLRIVKRERPSRNRWYLYLRLENPKDVDRELRTWLARSYELSA